MPLRIAQVSPLIETVPPECYGGTERIVSYLTEELVRVGVHVTLFASGGSVTAARLVAVSETSLRADAEIKDPLTRNIIEIEEVFKRGEEFDLIHFHDGYVHFPLVRRQLIPTVTTVHGRMDLPDLVPIFQEFRDMPLVSISDNQRTPLPFANWVGTVPHGLPEDLYSFRPDPEDYFVFIGRICQEKRPDRAIELAKRIGMPLKIAAKVDKADEEYFEAQIKPLLNDSLIEFVGEVNEAQKNVLLGGAKALLFPIDWPEPFGLVMIESLACGTPVLAFECGSVPEVLAHGKTAFVVRSMDEAEKALRQIGTLSRQACRQEFEQRFTVERMAQRYLHIYEQLLMDAPAAPEPREASKPTPTAARVGNRVANGNACV
jgi:glycosyltransferase involved in cell wall biosynthesis